MNSTLSPDLKSKTHTTNIAVCQISFGLLCMTKAETILFLIAHLKHKWRYI